MVGGVEVQVDRLDKPMEDEESQRLTGGGYQAAMGEAPTQALTVNGNGSSAHAEVGFVYCVAVCSRKRCRFIAVLHFPSLSNVDFSPRSLHARDLSRSSRFDGVSTHSGVFFDELSR